VTRHLIVYAKRPLPGYAKTRLGARMSSARTVGDAQAAGVYARLLYTYLLDLLHADLGRKMDLYVELHVAAPADVPFFAAAFPELTIHPQVEGDLGQRMAASFERAFAAGATATVLTGSDVPGLNSHTIRMAFDALQTTPLVIGPASDGGYYLIGMRAPGAPLFEGIAWSTTHVLTQTEALARQQGLATTHLPEHFDIDTIEDYKHWRQAISENPPATKSTLPERSDP